MRGRLLVVVVLVFRVCLSAYFGAERKTKSSPETTLGFPEKNSPTVLRGGESKFPH